MKKIDISIIMPIYNESQNIKIIIEEILNVLNNLKKNYEIICTNDGSTDNSYEVLKELASINKKIKIINFYFLLIIYFIYDNLYDSEN